MDSPASQLQKLADYDADSEKTGSEEECHDAEVVELLNRC